MSRPRRSPSTPYEIYSSSLETLYLGHALWYPEPHVTGEPQIGDVGFVRRGAFVRLFNLDTSAPEKKVTYNWIKPYKHLEPLPPGILHIDSRSGPLVPKHYCSQGVEAEDIHTSADSTTGTGVSATVSAGNAKVAQGAMLELQSEAHEETLFENHALKMFIARNYDQWYKYAKDDLGQDIEPGDIVFVSGWVKTTDDWAATIFSNTSSRLGASVKARVGGFAGIQVEGSYTRTVTGPGMERRGKGYSVNALESASTDAKKDQCTFLRRCKVRRRPEKVVAGAEYQQLPDSGDARGGSGGEAAMAEDARDMDEWIMIEPENEGKIHDHLDILLDYILETSKAEVAIADDDDVRSIVGGKKVVDLASYLRQAQPPVHIDGTLGSLCMEDVVSSERSGAIARRTITEADLAKWPNITTDDAGRLEDGHVFIGPTEAEARPLKMKHLAFADSRNPSHSCLCFALSSDGRLLAASLNTHDVLVWRLSDGLLVQRLRHQGHANHISSLSFSPRNHTLVSGSDDKSAAVWDVRSGRVLLRLEGHCGSVDKVTYGPGGALIATASSDDKSVKIWEASTGTCLQSFSTRDRIDKLAFSPEPEGSRLYAELTDAILIHDTETNRRITIPSRASSMSHQGDRIVAELNNEVNIRSALTGDELLMINYSKNLSSPVQFSPDGATVLAACDADKTAVAFDSQTGQLRQVFALSSRARCAAYSPNGEHLVLGDAGGGLKVFNADSGIFVSGFGVGGDLGDVQFLPDGRSVLVKVKDKPLQLYNIQDMMRMR